MLRNPSEYLDSTEHSRALMDIVMRSGLCRGCETEEDLASYTSGVAEVLLHIVKDETLEDWQRDPITKRLEYEIDYMTKQQDPLILSTFVSVLTTRLLSEE